MFSHILWSTMCSADPEKFRVTTVVVFFFFNLLFFFTTSEDHWWHLWISSIFRQHQLWWICSKVWKGRPGRRSWTSLWSHLRGCKATKTAGLRMPYWCLKIYCQLGFVWILLPKKMTFCSYFRLILPCHGAGSKCEWWDPFAGPSTMDPPLTPSRMVWSPVQFCFPVHRKLAAKTELVDWTNKKMSRSFWTVQDVAVGQSIFGVKQMIEEHWGVVPSCQRLLKDPWRHGGPHFPCLIRKASFLVWESQHGRWGI